MRLLVTGSSGFIGSHLLRSPLMSAHQLVVGRRSRTMRSGVSALALFAQDDDLVSQLIGFDAVIHLGGIVHRTRGGVTETEYVASNAHFAIRLGSLAARAGVPRFLFMSTAKVGGEATEPGRALSESDDPRPPDAYSRTKLMAETGLRQISRETGMKCIVMRPPLVYGPGVKANFASLVRALKRVGRNPFRGVRNRRSMVYVENLVAAVNFLLHYEPEGEDDHMFYIADDGPMTIEELADEILLSALGCARPLPVWPPLNYLWSRVAKHVRPLRALYSDFVVDNSAIASRGLILPYTTREGLRATVPAMEPY